MASKDLVKGYCKESKCEYDIYTKEKTDELLNTKANSSDVYTKSEANNLLDTKINTGNFSVLTGSITVPAGSDGTVGTINTNVSYPTGFTNNNCVPIAVGFKKQSDSNYIYEPSSTNTSGAYVKGYFNGYITMSSSNMVIYNSNSGNSALNLNYKIVLMKIS